MEMTLPAWASSLRERYLSGEASVFLLHGNVRDLQPWQDADGVVRYGSLREFLEKFFGRAKDLVVYYNVSEGVEFPSKAQETAFRRTLNARRLMEGRDPIDGLPRTTAQVLPLVEELVTEIGRAHV